MALENNIDLAGNARNPSDTFSIRTQNRDFSTQGLSEEESTLFEEQFNVLINDFDSRMVSQLFAERRQEVSDALGVAKNQFDESLFGGINAADNEIGFDVLRPGHIRADPSDGSILNDWKVEVYEQGGTASSDADVALEGTGWHDWIGDGTSGVDYTIDEDQVVLLLGFIEQSENTGISAVNVDRFGRNVDMLPKDLYNSQTADNENDLNIQALPTVLGTERDRVHIRLRADETGVYQPRLLGITYGVGAYMNQEDF